MLKSWRKLEPKANLECMRKKLNNWRAAYRRERKKIEESLTTASEPDEYHKPNLWYYDYLTFLHDDCPVLSKDDGDDDVGNDDTGSDNDEEGVVDDNIIEEDNSEEEAGSNLDDANDSEPEQEFIMEEPKKKPRQSYKRKVTESYKRKVNEASNKDSIEDSQQLMDKYINALVNHLNGLPDQPFVYDEADLLKGLEISDKEYYVEIRVKASEQNNASSKYQNCTGSLNIDGDGQILVKECQCTDFPENLEELVIDATTVDGPIQLENEVQTQNISTSGEQFIAVPRDKPAPCIGCATIVDPAASGVHELATLGVKQLDRHEPNTRHALNNVLLVERQVQVVGGVRYIMTLTIDYDNCTTNESNDCIVQKTCRISVLEKPWQKLPDGSKFRAIVSNNCTDEWLFGENGPSEPNLNNQSNDIGNPTSQYDPTGVGDDIVKAIHNVEVQAQPATEKVLTEYQIKELEEQIIPNVKVDQTTNNVVSGPTQMPITEVKFTTLDAAKPIEHIPSKHLEINKIEPGLPEDKKKTIDELINFFDFAGFKDKEVHDEIIRMKRDYGSDLKMLNVAENYQDMKTKLKNAQFIKKLALVMVNHINEMDIEARTRVFKEVISAEEETEKDQRYFYIKARVSLPCHKPVCKNEEFNICDGIIDVSGEQPSVLYTVCNAKPKINLGKLKNVPEKDTILLKFLKRALTKIDVESKNPYALRIRNILSATTQRVSGTLTKITVEIEYTECFKSVPLLKRKNCTALENLGYKVCDIEVVERHWLKESKLTYTCTDRPVDEMFVSDPHQLKLDDPKIHEVVQEALQNLELKSNRNNKQKLIEVKSVSTKQVAGVLINVVFTVGYTTCPSEFKDDVNTCELLENEPLRKCSVEVWERAWLDEERRLNISCEELSINVDSKIDSIQKIDSKKSMQTTEKEIVKDPSEYSKLADDCLTNYIATYGINQHYKVVKMHTVVKENVSSDLTTIDFEAAPTNCTAKNGYPTSSSCSVQGSAETLSCHAEVMTNPQLNTRMMKVNCLVNTKEIRRKREVLVGGKTTQDPKNPRYMELAERSLTKYVRKTRKSQYHKVVTIQEVKTQVVSGIKTIIQFKASPTNCEADRSGMSKGNSQLCVIEDSSVVLSCFADVYEQPWMGKEEIDVSCHPDRSRVKRDVSSSKTDQRRLLGGLKEKDVSDPTYTQLAKESLAKYVSSTGSTDEHTVIKINKVQTQVVAGTKTIIDFTVQGPANVFECHSKVWEQPWLNKKEIDVKCDPTNTRQKRQVPGGPVDQDVTDPKYKQLAEESLAKYVSTTGSNEQHKVIEIKKVHTQVVSGKMTIIDFTVQGPANVFECHSKVWEQPWLNKKEIDVKCDPTNTRQKRQVPGGPVDQDVTDPKYKQLAEESLAKYVSTTGSNEQHKVIEIKKVHTQVVSGKMTIIDFTVQGPANVFECHSKVWEQPWLNKKEIDIKCNPTVSRQKRQVPGGPVDQDVTDPKYKELAEESLAKYVSITGSNEQHKVIEIKKVHTQVVSGKMTIIDFTVQGPANVFECHSKVWEQPWLNKKEIDIKCNPTVSRQKRQVPGGPVDQDVTDPKYKQLAEESLAKYVSTTGSNEQHKVIKIKKVHTQVVSGKMTIIDFTVQGPANVLECHSKVWEQPWLNKKEIDVKCNPTVSRQKRQVPGGPVDQDVTDPKYKELAEESLAKYVSTTGSNEQHKVIEIKKVHTQVVSGKMTIIDFTVQGPANVFKCHSKVWEQPWLNKKEIDVKCDPTNKRQKRQVPGGPVDQDVTDPKYKQLAEESLAKYVSTTGSNEQHKVIEIKKVQTQVVSGKKTIIDFTVQGPGNVFECNSEVWEQPWLKKKDITVKCSPVQLRHRREVQLLSVVRNINRVNNVHSTGRKSGGQKEEDPTEPKYAALATEALRRFEKRKRSQYFHKVVTVDHVVTQVVSGQKILIDFTSSPTTCPSNATNEALCDIITNTTLYCRAEVWDRPWLKKKKINVFCNYENDDEEIDSVENMRKKRSLSSKSDLEIKNYIDKSEKTDTPVEVVNGEVEKVPSKKVDNSYLQKEMFYNSKHYLKAAEEALREYEIRSKSDVVYKVVKIHYVNEEDDVGVRARLDFTASPSNCTKTNYTNIDYCEFLDPKELISCHADLRLTMMLDNNMMKNYDVKCIQRKKKKTHSGEMGKVRNIRQMPLDENVEDDLMYYYADRVLSKLNTRFAGDNLYKLITVHDIRRTVHMKTPLVRMYLEVGKTLCLRDDPEVELSTCNEIDGLTHLLCYARLWPSIYDDIVLERTEVVCEDELQKFSPLAGFHTNDLLVVSMYVLNRDGGDRYFLRSVGNPHLSPTLDYNKPFRLSFIVVETNCTKEFVATIDTYSRDILSKCPTNERETLRQCHSQIYITPNSRTLRYVNVSCNVNPKSRTRRSISLNPRNITKEDVTIQKFVQEALQQLEMVSVVKYKQRVLVINRYSTKTAASKQTTIDFDVGYTNCLKYEWVDNITSCEFLEHLPRRHCVAVVTERLWSDSGRQTEVNCEDDETPLEANMELETAQSATTLAKEALKRIEYKYPHPRRQIVVRIFSLDKQMVAGVHYRLKMEVGYSTCMALSEEEDCKLDPLIDQRKFCRVNVWLRSWTNHPPSYRVSCDYQDGAVSEIFHQIQAQELFYHFMARHKPSYLDDHEEMQKRFAIFTQNVKKIHELNVYEMGTARYAVTQHADLTAEEFRKKYLGLDVSLRDENQLPMPEAAIPDVSLPDSFDWRDHDAVTEVKNQGGCGSCWAFSVTGNIEGQWKRHSGKLVSLSEQELVDCDKLDNGCNGGLPDNAYRAIEQLGGLELEADYPYEAEDDKCAFNKTLSRVQISGAVNISSNETNMAKWLVKNGPISIGINANAMQFYVGGISHPWKMLCNPSNLDHGVLIVGYGIKNYPLFNKKLPYWIVKNSWGPSWGEQGYYRVYRGDGTCGVNQMASSAVI
ncbi:hypothetical protein O0L34_g639 [Tuta absoluta]|nr:hypothetical protein O0L34_g639 [Tuta absoluta]